MHGGRSQFAVQTLRVVPDSQMSILVDCTESDLIVLARHISLNQLCQRSWWRNWWWLGKQFGKKAFLFLFFWVCLDSAEAQ